MQDGTDATLAVAAVRPDFPKAIMRRIVKAAIVYFVVVFAVAFLFGTLRVMVIAPRTGPLVAVAFEVPVILAFSWLVAGRVLERGPMTLPGRIAMGALAFGFLMLAEMALAILLFGQPPREFVAALATLPGALGLAGQIGFAAIPALRPQAGG